MVIFCAFPGWLQLYKFQVPFFGDAVNVRAFPAINDQPPAVFWKCPWDAEHSIFIRDNQLPHHVFLHRDIMDIFHALGNREFRAVFPVRIDIQCLHVLVIQDAVPAAELLIILRDDIFPEG